MKWSFVMCVTMASAAHAQETQPLPPRQEFVERSCVPAMMGQVGNSPRQLAFARAACECSYRLLAGREVMTRDQFDAAATVCRHEFEQDGPGFIHKYSD